MDCKKCEVNKKGIPYVCPCFEKQDRCPECGGKIEHEGGCGICKVCGYSLCK
jgi:uncharacterized UBP type Zn finger protein